MKMKIYDYDNHEKFIELPDKEIKEIFVGIITGDETGMVEFVDGTSIEFDASNCRMIGFNDGGYTVEGDNIQKWLNFEPNEKSLTYTYDRQDDFSSWGKLS